MVRLHNNWASPDIYILGKKFSSFAQVTLHNQRKYPIGDSRSWLVEQVVEADQLFETTMKLAKMIAEKSPSAVKAAKLVMNKGLDVSLEKGLLEQFDNLIGLCLRLRHNGR